MNFDYDRGFSGTSGHTVWDLAQIELVPLPSGVAEPIVVTYQGTSNPLENDTIVETAIGYHDIYYLNLTGTFVYAVEGTVTFADGIYTANYTKTLIASDSTVDSIYRFYNDLPSYHYEWSDGIPFADIVGKAFNELITDGSVIDLEDDKNSVIGTFAAEVFYLRGGDDRISARGGDDLIFGGYGQDRMSGNSGADTFVFEKVKESGQESKADVITDFASGIDELDFEQIDAKRGGADQAFKFLGEQDFSGNRGQLIFEHERQGRNRETHIYADIDGDKKADFVIILDGIVNLTRSDFVL